ncbi:MAG: NUDIX hydrolase [Paracoccaceae bacterium]
MNKSAFAALTSFMSPAFRRPEFVQTAALCVRQGADGPEVLLVSSLTSRRWIIPKGWPMDGRTLAEAAAQEAWEEAGIRGTVSPESMGSFGYRKLVKGGVPIQCRCEVYRIDVTEVAANWPEKKERERRWLSPAEAAARVEEPELKALLLGLL